MPQRSSCLLCLNYLLHSLTALPHSKSYLGFSSQSWLNSSLNPQTIFLSQVAQRSHHRNDLCFAALFLSRSNWACFICSHSQAQSSSPRGAQPCQFTLQRWELCQAIPTYTYPKWCSCNRDKWTKLECLQVTSAACHLCQGRRVQRKATWEGTVLLWCQRLGPCSSKPFRNMWDSTSVQPLRD